MCCEMKLAMENSRKQLRDFMKQLLESIYKQLKKQCKSMANALQLDYSTREVTLRSKIRATKT